MLTYLSILLGCDVGPIDIKEHCSVPQEAGSYCYNGPKHDSFGQIKSCAVPGTFAITFDDGPSNNTAAILDMLDKYDMKATFFLIGKNIDANPNIVQNIADRGHQIAAHTYSHLWLTSSSIDFTRTDMILNERALYNKNYSNTLSGGVIPRYMRAPHGAVTNNIMTLLNVELGYQVVHWSFLTQDSDNGTSMCDIKEVYTSHLGGENSTGVNQTNIGVISQQHDKENITLMSFDNVANYLNRTLAAKGTKFVTVAECMGDKSGFYRPNPRPTSDPTCSNGILSASRATCCPKNCPKCGASNCGSYFDTAGMLCCDSIRSLPYTRFCNTSIAPCKMF